eukprot:6190475-Pleurochrysis_carterae.AAC.1
MPPSSPSQCFIIFRRPSSRRNVHTARTMANRRPSCCTAAAAHGGIGTNMRLLCLCFFAMSVAGEQVAVDSKGSQASMISSARSRTCKDEVPDCLSLTNANLTGSRTCLQGRCFFHTVCISASPPLHLRQTSCAFTWLIVCMRVLERTRMCICRRRLPTPRPVPVSPVPVPVSPVPVPVSPRAFACARARARASSRTVARRTRGSWRSAQRRADRAITARSSTKPPSEIDAPHAWLVNPKHSYMQ